MPGDEAHTLLKQYLADHDAPCPVCSYNLRGLTAEKCPECGVAIELGVRSNESRLREWIIGLIAWATGLGTSATMLTAFCVAWARQGSLPRDLLPLLPVGGGLLVSILGLAYWIRRVGTIRKLRMLRRLALALLSWPIAVAWIAVFWFFI